MRPAPACAARPRPRTGCAPRSARSPPRTKRMPDTALIRDGDKIRCDACPVMCFIKPGATGACDRYMNDAGDLVRVDPHVILDRAVDRGEPVVQVLERA